MEHSESHIIHHTISILSTLRPTRSSRLGKIALEVWWVSQLFDKDGPVPVEDEEGEEGGEYGEDYELDEDDATDGKERG